jgi:hypothetical protein
LATLWSKLPYDVGSVHGHVWFPLDIVDGDTPPRMWFYNAKEMGSTATKVEVQLRGGKGWTGFAVSLTGEAALSYDTTYVLSIEGAQNQHEVSTVACSPVHPIFKGQRPTWVFATSQNDGGSIPKELPWLVAEHARHHKCLGMQGLILVTTPSRARQLWQHPDISTLMQKGTVVLIAWVSSLQSSCIPVQACNVSSRLSLLSP